MCHFRFPFNGRNHLSQPSDQPSKQTRAIKQYHLTIPEEIKMLEWLEANELLLNSESMEFKNTQKK